MGLLPSGQKVSTNSCLFTQLTGVLAFNSSLEILLWPLNIKRGHHAAAWLIFPHNTPELEEECGEHLQAV